LESNRPDVVKASGFCTGKTRDEIGETTFLNPKQ